MPSTDNPNPITTLRDAVRLRPGMYFATLDSYALYLLIYNMLDHAVDEAASGTCSRIDVVLRDGNVISVQDNGLGIEVNPNPETGQPYYQISPEGPPGKFNRRDYRMQASPFSLGLPVINAASGSFNVEVKRNGWLWQQQFVEGQPRSPLQQMRPLSTGEATGTVITLVPDFSIFHPNSIDSTRLSRRLRELAYLVPGLTLALEDKRAGANRPSLEFMSKAGVIDFVRYLNRGYKVLHEPIAIRETVELELDGKPLGISGTFDIAFQYADTPPSMILSFMNGVEVECEGPHIDGLKNTLWSNIKHRAMEVNRHEDFNHGFTEEDCLYGLTAVLSMQHPKPESCNSLYYVLANPELEDAVSELVWPAIDEFAEQYPNQMAEIIKRCLASKARRLQRRFEE
jgi:DNA gyrase subunit B